MASSDCNVFLPIDNRGRAETIATWAGDHSDLGGLGWELWIGSRGHAEQARLASVFGGAVAAMTPDGKFDRWLDPFIMDEETIRRRARRHPAFAELSDKQIHAAARELEGAQAPAAFLGALAKIPLADRMGDKLGFASDHAQILRSASPTAGDLFGGRSKAEIPVAVGAESAALVASLLEGLDEDEGHFDEVVNFHECYMFSQGRWLTPLLPPNDEGIPLAFQGKERPAVWIPVSQALALSNLGPPLTQADDTHLRNWITEEDRVDLLAIARAVAPAHFHQGAALAKAWFEQADMESTIPGARAGRKAPAL